jgi:uridine kinase
LKELYKNIFIDKYGNPKIEGLKSPLFMVGLGIKIILSCFFASHFLRDLFAPFLNYFVESGFANPYTEFNNVGIEEHFPYPDMMLYIMSVPRILFSPFLSNGINDLSALHLFVFRLPLLVFDFIILLVLLRWLKTKHKQVLWLYWLSPIVIYINYFHGQLDIIPIGMLIVSLYFLFKQKWVLSILVLAIACATKTNIMVVVPFIFIYAYKNNLNLLKCAALALMFLGFFLTIQLPYLSNIDYQQMVFANKVQVKVYDAHLPFGSYLLYFIVSAYFILVFRAITFIKINRNLLMLFLAFSFGVLTLFITPMQGWYMWLVPFFVYFVIQFNETQKYLYFTLVVFYFIYFSTVPNSDFPLPFALNEHQTNIIFTLLQTSLGVFLFALYHHGIRNVILQKLNYKPFLVGVGGDSGAGKSTFSGLIEMVMGSNAMSIVRGDDMHRWERGNEQWKTITHLNPKANDLHQDVQHTKALKEGKAIYRKHYDHNNGKFTLPQYIKSNTLVLFEGLHPFYLKNQADLYDLKIFFQPDESIRVSRKIQRDSVERDKPAEAVIKQLEDRKEDSEKYISKQKEHADIIVNYTQVDGEECLRLYIKNEIELDDLLNAIITNSSMEVDHQYLDNNMQELVFKGILSSNIIELIAYDQIQGLEEIGIYDSKWDSDYKGVIQLMTMQTMFYYLKA